MMRSLVLALIYFSLSISVIGQGWVRTHGNEYLNSARCILPAYDSGYIVGVSIYDPSGNKTITKLSESGDSLWGNHLLHRETMDLDYTIDEKYIAVGPLRNTNLLTDDINLAKFDQDGTLIWNQVFAPSDQNDVPNAVLATSDRGFLVAGYISQGNGPIFYYKDLYLLKADSLGNQVWDFQYTWCDLLDCANDFQFDTADVDEVFQDVIEDSDGNYVVVGTVAFLPCSNEQFNCNGVMTIMKIDPDGNLLWQRLHTDVFNSSTSDFRTLAVRENDQGNYEVVCDYFPSGQPDGIALWEVNKLGQIIDSTLIQFLSISGSVVHDATFTDNGLLAVVGQRNYASSLHHQGYISILDPQQGQLIKDQEIGLQYSYPGVEYLNALEAIENNGFVVTGTFGHATLSASQDILVAKLDSNLNCSPTPVADFDYQVSGNTVFLQSTSINSIQINWVYNSFWLLSGSENETSKTYTEDGIYQVCLIAQHFCAYDTICKMITIGDVGIDALSPISPFQVFPNPVQDQLYVQWKDDPDWASITLEIIDINGQVLNESISDNTIESIDVSDLPIGIYLLTARHEKNVFYYKFLKR